VAGGRGWGRGPRQCPVPFESAAGADLRRAWFRLELRLFADVALVGFPNSGKSTLISVVSAAKPKIADYPFTTLEPNLGVVRLDANTEFVMADIPGLIEGASEGIGLGHRFLRHVERARVLLYLLDLSAGDDPSTAEQLRVLRAELGAYRPDLLDRPSVVVGSKSDVLAADDWGSDATVEFEISSVTNQGLQPLMWRVAELVTEARGGEQEREGFVIHRPEAVGIEIVREDDAGYRVVGRAAERAVALSDLTDPGALEYARHQLTKLGVDKALRKAGASAGDTVRIGDFEFDYEEDL
jgi:GTPase